ncbi:SPOR domain-containing protein, partial [Phenylobacterium sp.]|uniref:SPOR domain-containing protein n=1 Tax=Phenylobacterium sp. TaxID=1871053 RepID=UPI00281203DB
VVVAQAPAPPAQPTLRPTLPAEPPAQKAATPPAAPVAKAPEPEAPAPKAPPPKAPEPKATPAPAAKSGGAVVQIGAVSSTALADKAWSEAVAVAGGSGKGKSVEKIERNGGTLYRTAVTGFASREDAVAFCNRLKAAGKSCFVR